MKAKHSPEYFAKAAEEFARQEYKRGWDDAVAALHDHAVKMFAQAGLVKPTEAATERTVDLKKPRKKKQAARRGNARKIVADAIRNNPGKTGTEIALMVADRVNKHTVRTQLRRLKDFEIEQHDMRWYAKGAFRGAAA